MESSEDGFYIMIEGLYANSRYYVYITSGGNIDRCYSKPLIEVWSDYALCLKTCLHIKKNKLIDCKHWYIVRSGSVICHEFEGRVIFSNDKSHPSYNEYGQTALRIS